MLSIGVVALGVGDVSRAAAFWCEALGYEIRTDGFGGWAAVLTPPAGGAGTKIALQRNETLTRAKGVRSDEARLDLRCPAKDP
jgi:catechol 2,3-dioxygenase-like lactoylglutathione lyase family enzyme